MVKESQPVPKRRVTTNTSPQDLRCLLLLRLWAPVIRVEGRRAGAEATPLAAH